MRTRTRRIAVTTGGAVLSLAALAACGGGSSDPKAGGTHPPTSTPTTTAAAATAPAATAPATTNAEPLTQAELWDAIITTKDLPGFDVRYTQLKGMTYPPAAPPSQLPTVSPAACAPVYWSTQATGAYQVTAHLDGIATSRTSDGIASFALTAYDTTDAPKVMADLHQALTACAHAHIASPDPLASGESYANPQVQPAPHLGDDALSFHLTHHLDADDIDPDPLDVPMTFTVVRVGATIVTFWNEGDATHTTPRTIPPELIPAQITKLTTTPHQPA
jgi:hypothetical protein